MAACVLMDSAVNRNDARKAAQDNVASLFKDGKGAYVRASSDRGLHFCLSLLHELAVACEAADNSRESAFWQLQLEVLEAQIVLAQKEGDASD